ncbi:glycosyltransferase family 39 protein [bacterium]|nr:glycosyltransferase family 39 protein [bacterium]
MDWDKGMFMTRLPKKNSLAVLFLLVFFVKAILLFVVIPELTETLAPLYSQNAFADEYDKLAINLVRGNGYRFFPETAETIMREPGYPMFLSVIFLIFGYSLTAVKLANLLLALVVAWVMTRIARKLSGSNMVILCSPLLFLFHPGTFIAESRGGVEILFTLFLTLFIFALYKAIESNKFWDYLVAGGMLGLTVLTKSTPILFPAFLFVYLLFVERYKTSPRFIFASIATMTIAMLIILSPWIIRNYVVVGKFVPTSSILGVSAHAGQYICKHLSKENRFVDLDRDAALQRTQLAMERGYSFRKGYYQWFYSTDDEVEFNTYLLKRVINEYKESPLLLLKCLAFNFYNFWCAGKNWWATLLNMIVQLPFLLLAMAGAYLSVRNGQAKSVGPIILFIAYYVLVYVPILAQARYSVPLIPFLSILACIVLSAVRNKCVGGSNR